MIELKMASPMVTGLRALLAQHDATPSHLWRR